MNIVLAHGIFGFRKLAGIEYFNDVRQHLQVREPSLKVLEPEVKPVEGIRVRGSELRAQILDGFSKGSLDQKQNTHIIAHSLGGLDARSILSSASPNSIADQITSLTTIGTPHLGSPVADILFHTFGPPFANVKSLVRTIIEKLGKPLDLQFGMVEDMLHSIIEKLGISLDGLRDLTTEKTAQFNAQHPDDPRVHYFSIAGRGRENHFPTCGLFLPVHALIKRVEGDNDGLVSVRSASRGETEIWLADHADEVGHDLDSGPKARPTGFDHLQEYENLVNRLSNLKKIIPNNCTRCLADS